MLTRKIIKDLIIGYVILLSLYLLPGSILMYFIIITLIVILKYILYLIKFSIKMSNPTFRSQRKILKIIIKKANSINDLNMITQKEFKYKHKFSYYYELDFRVTGDDLYNKTYDHDRIYYLKILEIADEFLLINNLEKKFKKRKTPLFKYLKKEHNYLVHRYKFLGKKYKYLSSKKRFINYLIDNNDKNKEYLIKLKKEIL